MGALCALLGMAGLVAGCGAGVRVPPADQDAAARTRQAQECVDALKPRRPGRPVIAVLASNDGTETTDFLLPHALLQRAGIADVQAVAPRRGPVALYPACKSKSRRISPASTAVIRQAPIT
jgi:hypothetical protein